MLHRSSMTFLSSSKAYTMEYIASQPALVPEMFNKRYYKKQIDKPRHKYTEKAKRVSAIPAAKEKTERPCPVTQLLRVNLG